VVGDRQRLDERGLVQRQLRVDLVHPATAHDDVLRQAASASGQADEVHVLREVVVLALRAGVHVVADDVGLDDDVVADLQVVDALADLADHARELMAERDRALLARDRMRMPLRRAEDRPVQVLVQVGAADAAPGHVDAHRAGLELLLGDVLDADVVVVVIACCLQLSLLVAHSQ
jgi:hypothetical protein